MNAGALTSFDAICVKTEIGREEIQSRALGLPPLLRRLLLLVDGRRSAKELAAFVPGHDVREMLGQLIGHDCIEPVAAPTLAPTPAHAGRTAAAVDLVLPSASSTPSLDPDLAGLPEPSERHANEIEMARHFMINTINTMHGQNTRLTLVKQIHACKDAAELRLCYAAWRACMNDSRAGAKRLPELRGKLLNVL